MGAADRGLAGPHLVVYKNWIDNGRSIPRFIQDYIMRRSIPNMLKAVKNASRAAALSQVGSAKKVFIN